MIGRSSWINCYGPNQAARSRSREQQESAHPACCRASPRRSAYLSESGCSASSAGTRLRAPKPTFARAPGAIRLPANRVLQDKIGHLLKRPVGRPPQEVRRYYASFRCQAGSWTKPRRVVSKVEWHPGELYPRVGFIVTNLARPVERLVAFYNHRDTCEQ